MKRERFSLVSVALILVLCLSLMTLLASCGGEIDERGSCTVVIAEGEQTAVFEASLEELAGEEGAIAALDYLVEVGKITYISEDGGYGAYLTEVSATDGSALVKQDYAENRYIYIYTSVEADMDVTSYAETVEYEGMTLTSTGVGISEMSLPDGAVIYITTIVYQ